MQKPNLRPCWKSKFHHLCNHQNANKHCGSVLGTHIPSSLQASECQTTMRIRSESVCSALKAYPPSVQPSECNNNCGSALETHIPPSLQPSECRKHSGSAFKAQSRHLCNHQNATTHYRSALKTNIPPSMQPSGCKQTLQIRTENAYSAISGTITIQKHIPPSALKTNIPPCLQGQNATTHYGSALKT